MQKNFKEEEMTKFPNLKDVSVTKMEKKPAYIFMNRNYSYIGNHRDFMLWARIHVGNVTQKVSRTTQRRRKKTSRGLTSSVYRGARPLVGIPEGIELLDKAMATCDTAKQVQVYSDYDNIFGVSDRNHPRPKILADVLLTTALVNKDFRHNTGSDFFTFCNGTIKDHPLVNVRALSDVGTPKAAAKLFVLERYNNSKVSDFIFSMDKFFHNIYTDYNIPKKLFSIPNREQAYEFSSKKNASAGFIELEPNVKEEIRDKVSDYSNGLFTFTTKLTPKKKQAAAIVVDRIYGYIDKAREILERGEYPEEGLMGLFRLIVKKKFELGLLVDFLDFCAEDESFDWQTGILKHKEKQRLYWITPQTLILLDRIISTPGIEVCKGGSDVQICAIGCNVIGGSYANLVRRLRLNPREVEPQLRTIITTIYEKYPDLEQRCYHALDFSKYDSLITSLMVLSASAYLALYPYDVSQGTLEDQLLLYLTSVSASHNSNKITYVPFLRKMFLFFGREPSGNLSTSVLDSIVQMVLRIMFIEHVEEQLLKKKDFINAEKVMLTRLYLLVALIYGDDRTEGIPYSVVDLIGLYSFSDWVSENFNWIVKEISPSREDPLHYRDSIGDIYFHSCGDFFKFVDRVDSPVFLKTKTARVYVDGVYLKTMPYRETYDIVAKMTNSISALDSPITIACAYSSLAWISGGNLEAYSIVKANYLKFMKHLGETAYSVSQEMSLFQERVNLDPSLVDSLSHSMRKVFLEGVCGSFPSWSRIASCHNIENKLSKKQPIDFAEKIAGSFSFKASQTFFSLEQFNQDFSKLVARYS